MDSSIIETRATFQSYPPVVKVRQGNPEAVKYGKLWNMEEYRKVAPGESLATTFLRQARPKAGASVIDFGCGTGRGGLMLAVLGRLKVTMVDFVSNCLDPEITEALTTQADMLNFVKLDLEEPIPINAQYGFCTDVMEHIPPQRTERVLDNILRAAQHVFFSISTTEDVCGRLIGEPLHLTVQPYQWWLEQFAKREAVVHWASEQDGHGLFYVSAWSAGTDITAAGVLNTEDEQIRANVRHNIAQGWEQVRPHVANDFETLILGGGPSLGEFEQEIKQRRANGAKLVTLNGAYNWAIENGLVPSAQIIVDARPFNARFTKPVLDSCRYLIASQCDPAVFEGLPKDRTYIWHTNPALIKDDLNAQYEGWYSVPGGSTVLLRAIPLMRMLGYRMFHLYGCDSCLKGERHHAYSQPENDNGLTVPVTVNPGGRMFYCKPWMISQAQEMMDLIKFLSDEVELEIHGDGLLKHILEVGASLDDLIIEGE
jgi:2-polyprenyl-3-methyl-5-hydroxy-6-metoxy-1,4-benzoquinol methylase